MTISSDSREVRRPGDSRKFSILRGSSATAVDPTGRLPDLCFDLFALAAAARRRADLGDPQALRSHVVGLLDRTEKGALEAGFSGPVVAQMRFPLLAVLNESISYSGWT